jgi:hypothetical protein
MTSLYLHLPTRSRRNARWRRWALVAAGVAALFIAPALAHSQGTASESVNLAWTAPGDDGAIGTAKLYEMRMSTTPIDASNWDSAMPVTGLAAPQPGGTREVATVAGLTRGVTYYFALRTQDDAGNWSQLSNTLVWDWSADVTAPDAPQQVTATRQGSGVRVAWNAPPQVDVLGYTVARSASETGPFLPLNTSLVSRTSYDDLSLPAGASRLWYSVAASDESQNRSAYSVPATVEIDDPGAARAEWKVETGYPNPSSLASTVMLPVVVPPSGSRGGTLVITDNGGRRVWQASLETLSPGRQLLSWDGRNEAGRLTAPGIYHVIVFAGGERASSRLVRVP